MNRIENMPTVFENTNRLEKSKFILRFDYLESTLTGTRRINGLNLKQLRSTWATLKCLPTASRDNILCKKIVIKTTSIMIYIAVNEIYCFLF